MTATDVSPPLRQSPLHGEHEKAGVHFTDFAGWDMPVRFGHDLAEHHAVRNAAGLFDLSHMAEFTVTGPEAGNFLDYAFSNRLSKTELHQAKYSLLLNDSGGIVDDVVVYRLGDDHFFVVANAGNHDAAAAALTERVQGFTATVRDDSATTALIAVQGPAAQKILEATAGFNIEQPLNEVRNYRATPGAFTHEPVLVARTGYTGEDGFELYIDTASAPALCEALLAAGTPLGLVPAGLACRDTLRLEASMPLYGHELGQHLRPAHANLGRFADLSKDDFIGKAALETDAGDHDPRLVGLVSDGRRAARAVYEVYVRGADAAAAASGTVTSGVLSPTLGYPVAMAFVDPAHAEPGTELDIDIRGKRVPFTVTALPFYRRKKN